MQPAQLNLRITRAATWRKLLTIMQPQYAYKPITSINKTAPLTLTVEHELPTPNWPIWIEGSTSSELNTDKHRQRFRMASVIDEQTIELNGINGHSIKATGGYVVYQLPVDFYGCTAVLAITAAHSASPIIELTEAAGLELGNGFINVALTAEQVQLLPASAAYSLVVTHGTDEIKWLCGEVTVNDCKNDCPC